MLKDSKDTQPTPALETFKILFVTDSPESATSLEAILSDPAHELVPTHTGVDAIQHLVRDDFALILLDVGMPGLDGFDTARLIKRREQLRHIPIIFLTSSENTRHFMTEGYAIGAADYLDKLTDPLILKAKVGAFVELSRKHREIEKALRRVRKSRRYEDAVHAKRGSRLILDAQMNIRAASGQFCELFRLAHKDVEGHQLFSLHGGKWDNPRLKSLLESVIAFGEPFEGFELKGSFLGAPERRALRIKGRRIIREEGESQMALLDIDDVTERSLALELETLRHREALQREFMANISHEFRTPVAAIKGFAETLRLGGLNDRANRLDFVKTIERHSEHLRRLVEDLLDLSAQESGRRKPVPGRIGLAHFVQSLLLGLSPLSKEKNLTVRSSIDPALQAWMDAGDLERVLQSLCENAIKFSGINGEIEIAADLRVGQILVSVRDQGPGIQLELLPHLFERFRKPPDSLPRRLGFGLGLTIAKGAVEANNGRIWAENNNGAGATFHFTIPVAEARAAEPPVTK